MLHYTSHYSSQLRFRRRPLRSHAMAQPSSVRSALEAPAEEAVAGPSISDSPTLQTKLKVGAANDHYEREADQVANAVVSGNSASHAADAGGISQLASPRAQRLCNGCDEELQRKPKEGASSANSGASSATVAALPSMGSSGSLPESPRRFFESRFNTDFSQVQVHTDNRAQQSAQSLGARAYTLGNHIVFNRGEYQPGSQEGKRLLAHELTHVVQQRQGLSSHVQRSCSDGNCEDCAGGVRTLWMTVFFARRATRATMATLRRRINAAKRILSNCCVDIKFAFNWTLIPNAATLDPATVRPAGDANGLMDVPERVEQIGESDLLAGSRGIPLLVVDEVRQSGGGATVLGGRDDQGRDFDLEYTGPSMFYMAVNQPNEGQCSQRDSTIPHELWHVAGALRHSAAEAGGIADCSSDDVNATYCAAVRGLT